jgi:hypothetical protein
MNRYSTMSAAGNNSPTKRASAHTRTMSPFEATRRSIAQDGDDIGGFAAQDDADFLLDSDNEEPKFKYVTTALHCTALHVYVNYMYISMY